MTHSLADTLHRAAWELIDALNDIAVDSVNGGEPRPITADTPVHRKMVAYERAHPFPHRAAPRCRMLWKRLLRLSRARRSQAFDCVDRLQDWLERSLPAETSNRSNGPDAEHGLFWWEGTSQRLPALQFQLVNLLWVHRQVAEEDLVSIWGCEPTAEAIKQLIKRTNASLHKLGVPFQFHQRNAYVFFE